MSRTASPLLLPLFRSQAQARVLVRIYLEPDRPAPFADIAAELGLDRAGVKREVDRLEAAGLARPITRPIHQVKRTSKGICPFISCVWWKKRQWPALAPWGRETRKSRTTLPCKRCGRHLKQYL